MEKFKSFMRTYGWVFIIAGILSLVFIIAQATTSKVADGIGKLPSFVKGSSTVDSISIAELNLQIQVLEARAKTLKAKTVQMEAQYKESLALAEKIKKLSVVAADHNRIIKILIEDYNERKKDVPKKTEVPLTK